MSSEVAIEEQPINQFYVGDRIVFLLISSVLLVLYSVTLYRDRYVLTNMQRLLTWPAKTVTRLAGTIATILHFAMAVDYFGAFLIHRTLTRFLLSQLQCLCWWFGLLVPCYHVAAATLQYWPDEFIEQRRTRLRRAFWFFGSLAYICVTLALFMPASLFVMICHATVGATQLVAVISVNYVYFRLRGFLQKAGIDLTTEEGKSTQLAACVRAWLKYAIATTIILGFLALVFIPLTIMRVAAAIRLGIVDQGFPVTPSIMPSLTRIILQVTYMLVLVVLLWRSWIPKGVIPGQTKSGRSSKGSKGSKGSKSAPKGGRVPSTVDDQSTSNDLQSVKVDMKPEPSVPMEA